MIEKLRELEKKHGSGWRFMDNTDDKSMSDEIRFLNAYLDARKEFMDLADAVERFDYMWEMPPQLHEALGNLNRKLIANMDA